MEPIRMHSEAIVPSQAARKKNRSLIYTHPLPITIFPLPTFIPHNPLSFLPIVFNLVKQTIFPTFSIPEPKIAGSFSSLTASVHIYDGSAIRFLWERGFFGKGNLSRSEPSWLSREQGKQGAAKGSTSEEVTRKRREERRSFKTGREQKRQLEMKSALEDKLRPPQAGKEARQFDRLDNSGNAKAEAATSPTYVQLKPSIEDRYRDSGSPTDQHPGMPQLTLPARVSRASSPSKSVRFSPDVEVAEFVLPASRLKAPPPKSAELPPRRVLPQDLIAHDEEHLQLSLQEAFYLVYGLGVLVVLDMDTRQPLPLNDIFALFRHQSHISWASSCVPQPDDPFIVNYVVYHHFRSLGWVVRDGVKFAADLLLYDRGPVFSHAEFAVIIIPSYNDPYYQKHHGTRASSSMSKAMTWDQLHSANRVQTHVQKNLILVFVDIPSPIYGDHDVPNGNEKPLDTEVVLQRYRIKEYHLKRWSMNRSRD